MPTLKEIEYLTKTGYVPERQLDSRDSRVGFSVMNYTPYIITLIVDDTLSYAFKIIPFAAKSVPIPIRKHIKVVFPTQALIGEEDYVEVGLYSETEAVHVAEAIGKDLIKKYMDILKKYDEEVFD